MKKNDNSSEFTNPFLELKKERLQQILKMIKALKKCDFVRFIALVQINLGLSKKTATEYIRVLRDAHYIVINGGEIHLPSHSHTHTLSVYNREEKIKK